MRDLITRGPGFSFDASGTPAVKRPFASEERMPAKDLGTKHVCWKCGTKFYDLKKADPVCPKCGADPRQAPVVKSPPAAERKKAAAAKPVAPAEEVAEVVEEADVEEELPDDEEDAAEEETADES
jgi:uncharacterized protein (TIGR02300 family)